jgi:hypothetical protein
MAELVDARDLKSRPLLGISSSLIMSRSGGWVVKALGCKLSGTSVVGSNPTRFMIIKELFHFVKTYFMTYRIFKKKLIWWYKFTILFALFYQMYSMCAIFF